MRADERQRQRIEAEDGGRPLIEHRTFRLVDGADSAAFVAADARFQTEVAYLQPGIIRRTTARAADGEWLVETIWYSAEHADACPPPPDELVDAATVRVRRYETLD